METQDNATKTVPFMSEGIANLSAALSAFQGSLKQPKLNKDVTVKTKTGGSYKFRYADLYACMEAAAPALKENGLAVTQIIRNWTLVTILAHKSGEWISSEVPISLGSNFDYQALGSAITYLKRYTYCAILGIVADADDDANAACGNLATVKERKTAPDNTEQALSDLSKCTTETHMKALWSKWEKDMSVCSQGSRFHQAFNAKWKSIAEA